MHHKYAKQSCGTFTVSFRKTAEKMYFELVATPSVFEIDEFSVLE